EVAGGVEVASDAGTFTAGMVVGAGGHGCPVARVLGRARAEEHVVVTQESETRVGAERLRALTPRYGWPELIAEPDFKGYGWYFTKGDFLNVGVGALGGEPVRRRLERLLARLRASGRLPDALALTPFRGHAYAIRRGQPRRLGGERFALVGDAAGLARDVSSEVYALFLDRRMVYTCAYYRRPDGELNQAQEDKLDLVCRKLRLQAGERLLDIGCGWGSLVVWAAERYGALARGVTLSRAQAEYAQASIHRRGLEARARVDHLDYRDLPRDLRFDK